MITAVSRGWLYLGLLLIVQLLAFYPAAAAPGYQVGSDEPISASYVRVLGVSTQEARAQISATGVAIIQIADDYLIIAAIPVEIAQIKSMGFVVEAVEPGTVSSEPAAVLQGFPAGESDYHTYAEMEATIRDLATRHSSIVRMFSIGKSYEGREIWAVKISDVVGTDQPEPEVLLVGGHHAREHITVEMTIYALQLFANGYGADARITSVVNSREIWIVFNLNPDGSEYDISPANRGGPWTWRKNRQSNPGSTAIGTDLNRNYGYQWGGANASTDPASETYRGAMAFSAPETAALRAFVNSRVIGGQQQIRSSISFHNYAEQVLWPWSFAQAPIMWQDERASFEAVGRAMAASNGYLPQQSSALYPSAGDLDDWLYGEHGIFAFTFELSPRELIANRPFYIPDEQIPAVVERNREAVLYLAEQASCLTEVIGKACLRVTYASPGGADSRICSVFQIPCKTIAKALAVTPAESTLYLAPGTYQERIVISQPVTIRGSRATIGS